MIGQIYIMECHNYYYVGKHTGDIFIDKYYGIGIAWKNEINKYGEQYVNRRIIATYDTEEEGNELEKIFIAKYKKIYRKRCLNIADGGQGGNLGEEVNKRISKSVSGERNGMYGKKLSVESRRKISNSLKEINHKPNKGKSFDDEIKRILN